MPQVLEAARESRVGHQSPTCLFYKLVSLFSRQDWVKHAWGTVSRAAVVLSNSTYTSISQSSKPVFFFAILPWLLLNLRLNRANWSGCAPSLLRAQKGQVPGIGAKTIQKINEFLETGKMQTLVSFVGSKRFRKTPRKFDLIASPLYYVYSTVVPVICDFFW